MLPPLSPERLKSFAEIALWIIEAGNQGRSERGLTRGLATRLVKAGIPIDRVTMGSEVLDPIFRSRNYTWTPEADVEHGRFEHGLRLDRAYLNSPFKYVLENHLTSFRVRLADPFADQFPILVDLRGRGLVDYYVRVSQFGESGRTNDVSIDGMLSTFSTRRPEGFTDEDIAFIDAILPAFALAFHARLTERILGRTLSTYLGKMPAERVLQGNILRGETETLDAVVWMSDLSGFTRTADTLPQDQILEFLNAHAEIVADAITENGGEVLKFIGDGILAVFPSENGGPVPADRALEAAIAVARTAAEMSKRRRAAGLATSEIVVALHRGEVLFGNFGSSRRLDFTALGPAVNEASRICSLSKTLDQKLLFSEAFRDALPANDNRLVSVGRYALRGVGTPRHLFTLDRSLPAL